MCVWWLILFLFHIYACSERLRSNSDQFNKLLNKKQYLPAVEVLMNSINSWNENLDKIEGLREVRTDLKVKKEVRI